MNIVQRPSPNNYTLDESPFLVILHTTLGSYEGSINWLTNPASQVSAHFVVGRNGEVSQLVQLNRGAWHAGGVSNPTPRAKDVARKDVWGRIMNPNRYSIGIEHAAGWDIDKDGIIESWEKLFTPKMVKKSAELILYLEEQLGISIPDKNILTHRDIAYYKPDLEIQRSMILATLKKLRETETIVLNEGDRISGIVSKGKITISKK